MRWSRCVEGWHVHLTRLLGMLMWLSQDYSSHQPLRHVTCFTITRLGITHTCFHVHSHYSLYFSVMFHTWVKFCTCIRPLSWQWQNNISTGINDCSTCLSSQLGRFQCKVEFFFCFFFIFIFLDTYSISWCIWCIIAMAWGIMAWSRSVVLWGEVTCILILKPFTRELWSVVLMERHQDP